MNRDLREFLTLLNDFQRRFKAYEEIPIDAPDKDKFIENSAKISPQSGDKFIEYFTEKANSAFQLVDKINFIYEYYGNFFGLSDEEIKNLAVRDNNRSRLILHNALAQKHSTSNIKSSGEVILSFFCPPDRQEEVIGDLQEFYETRWLPRLGHRWARWVYLWHCSSISARFAKDGVLAGIVKAVGKALGRSMAGGG